MALAGRRHVAASAAAALAAAAYAKEEAGAVALTAEHCSIAWSPSTSRRTSRCTWYTGDIGYTSYLGFTWHNVYTGCTWYTDDIG